MEKAYAFLRDLAKPVHQPVATSWQSGQSETAVDASWRIECGDNMAPTAAADLTDFLSRAFNLKLRGGDGGAVVITADEPDPAQSQADAQGFAIRATAGRITVHGATPRGALFGLYHLEDLMRQRGGPCIKRGTISITPTFAPRIFRGFSSPYYTETIDGKQHYDDVTLSRIAHLGYDAIWLRGELRDLSRTDVLPDLGQNSKRNLAQLNDLIERAAAWGIGIYLYLCEPHGLPADDPFWKRHPDLRGASGPEMGMPEPIDALCTSTAQVKRYLFEASRDMFRHAPGIEGLLLITASEHTGHCKQRNNMPTCPRCARRRASSLSAEVIKLIHKGVRAAGSDANICAWNWAWKAHLEDGGEQGIIDAIPPDVKWMGNAENGAEITRFGHRNVIHEYSLCEPGPSGEYVADAKAAHKAGHDSWSKVQVNVTHELASLPYVPVPFLLGRKFKGLAEARTQGLMTCWIFGGYPGPGAAYASAMMWQPHANHRRVLLQCAASIYGAAAAEDVVRAWRAFSDGYAHYPFDRGLYSHVLNAAPAHPFYFMPVNRIERSNWRLKKDPFGDILHWCVAFSPEVTARCYERMLEHWDKGMAILRSVMRRVPPAMRDGARKDMGVCEAAGIHVRSGLQFVRFIRMRDRLPGRAADFSQPKLQRVRETLQLPLAQSVEEINELLDAMSQIVKDEKRLVQHYIPLVEADSRLGYHSEGDYRFRPADLRRKVRQLDGVLHSQIPRYRRSRAAGH